MGNGRGCMEIAKEIFEDPMRICCRSNPGWNIYWLVGYSFVRFKVYLLIEKINLFLYM